MNITLAVNGFSRQSPPSSSDRPDAVAADMGSHNPTCSTPTPRNDLSATPATITRRPLISKARPTTDESSPKESLQRPWLMTATGPPTRCTASVGRNARPIVSRTPRAVKKFSDTTWARPASRRGLARDRPAPGHGTPPTPVLLRRLPEEALDSPHTNHRHLVASRIIPSSRTTNSRASSSGALRPPGARRKRASTTAYALVVAPTPIAIMTDAPMITPGTRSRARRVYRSMEAPKDAHWRRRAA
jgi:hypothetical protein